MTRIVSNKDYADAKKHREKNSKGVRYFGGNNNPTGIAGKHYKEFANRSNIENAKAIDDARAEQKELREKRRINLAKSHTGKMNWSLLRKYKCPYCERKLTDASKTLMICDIHPGPAFRIGKQKLLEDWINGGNLKKN